MAREFKLALSFVLYTGSSLAFASKSTSTIISTFLICDFVQYNFLNLSAAELPLQLRASTKSVLVPGTLRAYTIFIVGE